MYKRQLTKLTCYIDTAVNAAKILPTEKGCIELEQLKEKMEWKIEEMEAGYDRLIELDPDNEKRYLEKKREVVDIAVASHAKLLPAITHCQEPARANRLTHENRDPQVKSEKGSNRTG